MTRDLFPGEGFVEDPNRRYTTSSFMEWIKERAGVTSWDLDAAADLESHHAPRWFSLLPYPGSAGVDGLAQSWLPTCPCEGGYCTDGTCDWPDSVWRIFVNPPFDDLEAWVAKAWATMKEAEALGVEVRIAFVLPGNRHEQPFWQRLIEPYRDGRRRMFGYDLECHFPAGRQAYAKPGSNGVPVGSADFPSCLLVWRRA